MYSGNSKRKGCKFGFLKLIKLYLKEYTNIKESETIISSEEESVSQ